MSDGARRRAIAGTVVAASLLAARIVLLGVGRVLERVLGGGSFGSSRRPPRA